MPSHLPSPLFPPPCLPLHPGAPNNTTRNNGQKQKQKVTELGAPVQSVDTLSLQLGIGEYIGLFPFTLWNILSPRFPPLPEATFLGQIAEVPLTPLPVSTETSGKRMLKEERFWVVNSARCLRPKSALALRLADAESDKMRGKIPSLFPVNSFLLD